MLPLSPFLSPFPIPLQVGPLVQLVGLAGSGATDRKRISCIFLLKTAFVGSNLHVLRELTM